MKIRSDCTPSIGQQLLGKYLPREEIDSIFSLHTLLLTLEQTMLFYHNFAVLLLRSIDLVYVRIKAP